MIKELLAFIVCGMVIMLGTYVNMNHAQAAAPQSVHIKGV